MGDTAVPITAGSGTNIDTRTESTNSNHRQVMVIGDPATNAGVAPVDVTAGLKVDLGTDNDVVVSSSALPTGAATAAKQPALGTAGSASTDVLSVQGIASGVALPVSLATLPALVAGTAAIGKLAANSGVDIGDVDVTSLVPGVGATNLGKAEDAAHSSGDTGVMALAVRTDTGASLAGTDGDYAPLQLDNLGNLRVNVAAGSASNAAASATGSAVPASADYRGLNVGGTLRGATGLSLGSHFAGAIAVVDASGNQITSFGGSAGVVSTARRVAAGSGDAVSVKASAGTLRSVHVFNKSDVPVYVKFHNTAGTPTPGSGVVFGVGVQGGVSRDLVLPGGGRSFSTGIGLSIVSGIADTNSTGVTADDCVVEIAYE